MGHLLLGIDVGTGSCKCAWLDPAGTVVARAAQEYSPLRPQPGWVEQHPGDWYEAFVACLRQAEAEAGLDPRQVGAIGVTGQMRGPTFLDPAGSPLRPSILWNDLRCHKEVVELQADHGELLARITHNPLNTMCTLPKLLWLKRHEPHTWQQTATILYPKDYINLRLTGTLATDHSDASGSSFYDLERRGWSDEILDTFDLSKDKLPPILGASDVVGTVSRQTHLETGLSPGLPVVAGGSDATVEMLAIGIEDERQCKVRLGTSGALSTVVNRLEGRPPTGSYCWAYLQPDQWMIDVNTRTCADATVWLKEVFYQDAASSEAAYRQIAREAASMAPGADGLFFHPYLLGEDAPYWQPHLKGSFFGLTRSHSRAHCARAVLEGTGFALRDARSVMGGLVPGFEKYVFVGGGTQNSTWLGIVADILGLDGRVSATRDAAVGAALLAGTAAGAFDSPQQTQAGGQVEGRVWYNRQNHDLYNQLYDEYVRIKRVFDALYP